MRALLLVVAYLVGACRGSDSRTAPATPPTGAPPAGELANPAPPAGSAVGTDPWATGSAGSDPWATGPAIDAIPDLAARKRLANEACPRVTAPYFYKIEKAGKVSHILGTRHVGVPLSKFPPVVHEAIASARLVVFEVAPGDDFDGEDVEVSLPDELGPELWSHYTKLVGKDVASSLKRATPSAALLMLMVMYEDIGAMLDVEIQRQVLAAGIPTKGLEKAQFQDALLDELLDIRMLRASIEHTEDRDELAKESREDLTEYCSGTDEDPGMDADMRRDLLASGYTQAEIDRIDDLMVHARNADWIPKLEPMLKTGDVFIAVGADHLTGPKGVVSLLAARGYKLTRVK